MCYGSAVRCKTWTKRKLLPLRKNLTIFDARQKHRPTASTGSSYGLCSYTSVFVGRIAQSVQRLATGWTVWGSNSGGGEIFHTRPDRSWGPLGLLYTGCRVFTGGKAAEAWRCGVDHPPDLVPRLKKEYSYTLLPLWAFVVCSAANFTYTSIFIFSTYYVCSIALSFRCDSLFSVERR